MALFSDMGEIAMIDCVIYRAPHFDRPLDIGYDGDCVSITCRDTQDLVAVFHAAYGGSQHQLKALEAVTMWNIHSRLSGILRGYVSLVALSNESAPMFVTMGRYFKIHGVFDAAAEEEANLFMLRNQGMGVISEIAGKVLVADCQDEGTKIDG